MAGTAWHVLTRYAPRQWLLADGTTITEPTLEQTSSGRKVRIQGAKESVFYGALDEHLNRWAIQNASDIGTRVLSEVTDYEANLWLTAGIDPKVERSVKLHTMQEGGGNSTQAWWRFELPGTPYQVLLVAQMQNAGRWNAPNGMNTQVTLYMPSAQLSRLNSPNVLTFRGVQDYQYSDLLESIRYSDDSGLNYTHWINFMSSETPNWDSRLLNSWSYTEGPHQAVAKLLKAARSIESEGTIQVPDFSDPSTPAWLTLELLDTNINSQFITDMVEYLDTDSTAEQILDLYKQMQDKFRQLGVATDDKTTDDFAAAIVSGDKGKLSMRISNPADLDYAGQDHTHSLSVHLPTGSFIVECFHRHLDKQDVLDSWDAAKTVAALGGEEDVFLAYAREFAKKAHKGRTKQIIANRKGND